MSEFRLQSASAAVVLVLVAMLAETDTSVYSAAGADVGASSKDAAGAAAAAVPRRRPPRHTPFMPDEYWRGAPEFGPTRQNVSVTVNGTAELVCPIGHVQDSAVSKQTNSKDDL